MRIAALFVFLTMFFSVNHSISQTRLWDVSDTSQPNSAVAKVALDGSGNVFLGLQGTNIAAVEKLDSTGAIKWLAAFHDNFDVAFQDMIVDAAGNSYMCGNVQSASNGTDALIVKVNPLGTIQWSPTLDYKQHYDNYTAMKFDGAGNIIAIGTGTDSLGFGQVLVTKYTATGTVIWSSHHGAPNLSYQGQKVTLDASGNIYVASDRQGFSSGYDFNVTKFDPNGNFQWEQTLNSSGTFDDIPLAIAVDNAGNVYLAGRKDSSGVPSGFVAKVDATGDARWSKITHNTFTQFNSAALDNNGNLYVAGTDSVAAYIAKIDTANGNASWNIHYSTPNVLGGYITAMQFKNSNFYATGFTGDSVGGQELITLKVSSDGHLLYSDVYYSPTSAPIASGYSIVVGSDGNFYAGGSTNINLSQTIPTVLRYNETPTGIFEMANNAFTVNAFPNPTAKQLQFTFNLTNAGYAAMYVYDINGKQIATAFNQQMAAGKNTVQWDAESLMKGTYLYEIVTPAGKSTGKFVKF